jgi:hypothetical protein
VASTFTRLYRYAKAVGADAKENFTTEALRAAIETDARPMLIALRTIGFEEASDIRDVATQCSIAGAGIIDLILTLGLSEGRRRTIWIEVKVDADESGDQIANYRRFIEKLPENHRPALVVLGPRSLRDGVLWLSWQQVRVAINGSGTASSYWLDLKTYLEEIRMADNYDEPLSQAELEVLGRARSLLGKTTRMLTPFALAANGIWRGAGWPDTEADVQSFMLGLFGRLGTYRIGNVLSGWHGLSAGLHHSPAGEARIGLWIWMNPKRVFERSVVLEAAAKVPLGDEWHLAQGDWEVFGAYRAATQFATHADATSWLIDRFVQMRDVGLLDLLKQVGAGR